jgi:hypothetical protein
MSNATELLRRALETLEWCDEECCDEPLEEAIRDFLAAEKEAEPVGFEFTIPSKELVRYHNDEDCIEIKVDLPRYPAGSRFYPPKPAKTEAKPVAWRLRLPLKNVWHFQDDQESVEALCLKGWIAEPLYTRPEPARKPMTEEEIDRYLDNECLADFDARIFKWAIIIAEKNHGIGGDDNG